MTHRTYARFTIISLDEYFSLSFPVFFSLISIAVITLLGTFCEVCYFLIDRHRNESVPMKNIYFQAYTAENRI